MSSYLSLHQILKKSASFQICCGYDGIVVNVLRTIRSYRICKRRIVLCALCLWPNFAIVIHLAEQWAYIVLIRMQQRNSIYFTFHLEPDWMHIAIVNASSFAKLSCDPFSVCSPLTKKKQKWQTAGISHDTKYSLALGGWIPWQLIQLMTEFKTKRQNAVQRGHTVRIRFWFFMHTGAHGHYTQQ